MTTLTQQAHGSPTSVWIEVGGGSYTVPAHSLYEQTSQEIVGGLAYMLHDFFFSSDDDRTETETHVEFERLAAEWKQETAHLSSPGMIATNRAYQEVIGMGKDAIPFILRDLEKSPAQWFWALGSITRESPVRPEDRGDVDAMTVAWLDWGRRNRHI
jgi:hypothetical protein